MNRKHPINSMCEMLEVSRRGYYQWQSEGTSVRARQTNAIRAKITRAHEGSRGTYESPRVTAALHEQDESMGPNCVARLMREAGLQGPTSPPVSGAHDRQHA